MVAYLGVRMTFYLDLDSWVWISFIVIITIIIFTIIVNTITTPVDITVPSC